MANRRKLRKPGALIPRFLKVGGGVTSVSIGQHADACSKIDNFYSHRGAARTPLLSIHTFIYVAKK